MTTEMLETARRYVAAGMSVIPITRGDKSPDHPRLEKTTGQTVNWVPNDKRAAWRTYCTRMPTDAELVSWFAVPGNREAGIGIVGGAISGGLVRIDFEHPACLLAWLADLHRVNPDLASAAKALPIVQTGKGHHVYLRMPEPPGHEVLSSWGSGNDQLVLAETQGEGCYCVAPPSVVPGSFEEWDKSSSPWRPVYSRCYGWISGLADAVPTFDQGVATTLLNAARFSELWGQPLSDEHQTQARLDLYCVLLTRSGAGWHQDFHLNWDVLHALRGYLERYEGLIHVVETAPPPPPSYYDDGGDDGEW